MVNLSLEQTLPEPTMEKLKSLSQADFTNFLMAIFFRAGYSVTKLDAYTIKLDDRGIVKGVVSIAFGTEKRLDADPVDSLRKKVLEQIQHFGFHVEGYMISRTGFTDRVTTENNPQMVLLNGENLLKFHSYLVATRPERSPLAPVAPEIIPLANQVARVMADKPKVIAITNNKGGIGKSTTAANLAFGLAQKGYSVLAVDLDGQANLTEMLSGYNRDTIPYHLGMYFSRETSLNALVLPTPFKNLKLIPARPDMVPAAVRSEDQQARLLEFALALRGKDVAQHPIIGAKGFDWIVMDTSPDMGFYTQAALYAANYLITPVVPNNANNNGVQVLWDTSQRIRQLIASPQHGRYLGFLVSMYDGKPNTTNEYRNLNNFVADILRTRTLEGGHSIFFDTLIPFSQSVITATRDLKLATQQNQPYPLLNKEGRAGDVYEKFIQEVLKRV